jgi:hypothetical protein
VALRVYLLQTQGATMSEKALKRGARAKVGAKAEGRGKRTSGFAPAGALAAGETGEAEIADLSAFDEASVEEVGGDSIAFEERQLLARIAKFLFTVTAPRLLRRALRAGYTREEHTQLWQLFSAGAGRNQSLDVNFQLAGEELGGGERLALLQEVDAFENLWFPRCRAIIARRVSANDVEQFTQGFFRNLSQQPLGPLVLDSVSTFLDRVEALEGNAAAGAALVFAELERRGLSEGLRTEIRNKITRARSGVAGRPSSVDTAQRQAVRQAQQDALRELRLAWNDWSTTLRPLFDVREQVQLGLTDTKVRVDAPEKPAAAVPVPAPTA